MFRRLRRQAAAGAPAKPKTPRPAKVRHAETVIEKYLDAVGGEKAYAQSDQRVSIARSRSRQWA